MSVLCFSQCFYKRKVNKAVWFLTPSGEAIVHCWQQLVMLTIDFIPPVYTGKIMECFISFAAICLVIDVSISWWRHDVETLSVLLAVCEGIHYHRWIPLKRPMIRKYNGFVAVNLNKLLSKYWNWRGFETSWRSCDILLMVLTSSLV